MARTDNDTWDHASRQLDATEVDGDDEAKNFAGISYVSATRQ
jgi:hypothetical protein